VCQTSNHDHCHLTNDSVCNRHSVQTTGLAGIKLSWHLTIHGIDNNDDDDDDKQWLEHEMIKKPSINSAQLTHLH